MECMPLSFLGFESWNADSLETERMIPEITLLIDDSPPAKGDTLEVTEPTFVPVQGCGRVGLQLQQVGDIKTVALNNIA